MIRSLTAFALLALALCPSLAVAETTPPAKAADGKAAKPDAKPNAKAADAKAAAPAPAPGAPQLPTPPVELDKLKFLVGNFNCDGSSPIKGALDHTYKAKITSKLVLGNFFVGWQYAEIKAKDHPFAMLGEGRVSWDGGLKRFLYSWADSAGTTTMLRAEMPADVDQYVFKGTATASFGRHVPFVLTISRTPTGFDMVLEGTDNDGQLARLMRSACTAGKGK